MITFATFKQLALFFYATLRMTACLWRGVTPGLLKIATTRTRKKSPVRVQSRAVFGGWDFHMRVSVSVPTQSRSPRSGTTPTGGVPSSSTEIIGGVTSLLAGDALSSPGMSEKRLPNAASDALKLFDRGNAFAP